MSVVDQGNRKVSGRYKTTVAIATRRRMGTGTTAKATCEWGVSAEQKKKKKKYKA